MGTCGTTIIDCKALKINRLLKAFFVELKHMLKLLWKPLLLLTCRETILQNTVEFQRL